MPISLPTLVVSQSDMFIVFAVAAILFGGISFLILYHLNAYGVIAEKSHRLQLLYLLGASVIILATASVLFFL